MDSLNKHVQQISFRQSVTFCEHRQLKGRQPRFQPTEAKCSISTLVPWFATVTCHTWEHNQKPAWNCFFSAAATKGWEWCKKNAELVEHTVPLRDLKLLVGSGGLDFTKGMDSLNKHVQHISCRQWVTFWEHRQPKGWQPHVQLTVAKSSISTIVRWFAAVT